MLNTVYTNVQILDGSGNDAYGGEVLVRGSRIKEIARDGAGVSILQDQSRLLGIMKDGNFHKRPAADIAARRQAA